MQAVQLISLGKIIPNPDNPRTLKDERFNKLVQSLTDFPEMLEKRPLICVTTASGKFMVLGGNQRLKAAIKAGIKQLPVILADDWSEEKRQEFIVKDNVNFGSFDWDMLATDWNEVQLIEWGLEMPEDEQPFGSDEFGENFTLPDGDKAPFQQMTFTLADEQAKQIKNAIADIKRTDEYKYAETMGNENSNGNALYLIIMQWAEQRR